jgi:hypothetical protein
VYDGTDPNQLTGDTGRGLTAAYSLDFTRYLPMCPGCHIRFSYGRQARALELDVAVLRVALWLTARAAGSGVPPTEVGPTDIPVYR